jgi:hypothetical protein
MNAPLLWKLRKECLTGIGHVATVFVAAFPIVFEPFWRTVDVQFFYTSNFPAYLLVFLLS